MICLIKHLWFFHLCLYFFVPVRFQKQKQKNPKKQTNKPVLFCSGCEILNQQRWEEIYLIQQQNEQIALRPVSPEDEMSQLERPNNLRFLRVSSSDKQ